MFQITGGGSGIGLMATQALATNGAKVYICGRTKEKLDTVASTYGKEIEGEIIPVQADISSKDGIKTLLDKISSNEECLCILVNNAGISGETFNVEVDSAEELKADLFDTEKATFEDWTDQYRTNVASTYFMTAAFLPLLQSSSEKHPGWSGTVINVSSISGLVKTGQHHYSYNASKAATVHLTRMLASDVASQGLKIRINNIAPGLFPSEMTTGKSDERQKSELPKDKMAGKIPAARPGKDEDMASAFLLFAANQYINGQTLAVDGGYTLAAGM
jgi:NAD(P)-dependent dehydrogenase (short-subunit alcohol dehydrogenase family)